MPARHGRPPLYAAARVGLVVAAIAVLLNFVLPEVLSAIPFADLPDLPDGPDMPGWLRWLRIAVVIAVIALIVVGEIQKDRDNARGE